MILPTRLNNEYAYLLHYTYLCINLIFMYVVHFPQKKIKLIVVRMKETK